MLSRLLEALAQFAEENARRLSGGSRAGLQSFTSQPGGIFAGRPDRGLEGRPGLVESAPSMFSEAAKLGGNLAAQLACGIADSLRERVADITEIACDLVEVLSGELGPA
jgi:hypothetical protein